MSRSFLIDAQCLFFSLLCFFVGTFAARRGSVKLSLVAGLFFSAALMTKLYAIFVLLPLFLFYLYYRPKNQKLILSQLAAFIIPALASAVLWYQLVLGTGLPSMFGHIDFSKLNPAGTVVSPFFVGTFLIDYALGPFFLAATVFSLLLCFSFRKHFSKILAFDLICLVTIGLILVLDLVLGAGLNLNAPYISIIKYDFQALPFFCLLAASLVAKSVSLLKTAKLNVAPKKILLHFLALAGLALLAASLIFNMLYAHTFSTLNYFLFRVARGVNYVRVFWFLRLIAQILR